MDSVAMNESATKVFARGGDIVIDTRPPITRYWVIDTGSKFILKNFMVFGLRFLTFNR